MEKYFSISSEDLAVKLNTDLKHGLSSQEALKRLKEYGPNQLKQKKGKNPLVILLSQFTNLLVIILILASIASFFLGEGIDAIMIVIIIIMNALIGFVQEYRVEKAIDHLKKIGFKGPSRCELCRQESEDTNHILYKFSYSQHFWDWLRQRLAWTTPLPNSLSKVLEGWPTRSCNDIYSKI